MATSSSQEGQRKSLLSAEEETRQDRLQRAAIVGQLAGGIFHDFNNVLTVIIGMIDLLSKAVAHEPQLAAMANLIDQAATRGAALTSSLLAFARTRCGHPREVDVNALLVEATRLLRPALRGIEITMVTASDLPAALVEPGQLLAAVLSLAVAARNAMPEGARLSFETAMRRTEGGAASSRGSEEHVVVTLRAYGYGDVAEHPDQIFTDAGLAEDFIGQAGGRLKICAPSDDQARAEILLPSTSGAAPWLADT